MSSKQALKSLVFAAWIVGSLACWGWVAAVAALGSAIAETPPPDADFTMLYVLVALVALIFIGWCAATWALARKMNASATVIWLAILFALLTALFLA